MLGRIERGETWLGLSTSQLIQRGLAGMTPVNLFPRHIRSVQSIREASLDLITIRISSTGSVDSFTISFVTLSRNSLGCPEAVLMDFEWD